jgi:hypothetical protein
MAKKKSASRKKPVARAVKKKAAGKRAVKKKPAAKRKTAAVKKPRASRKRLGRPKVTADARLDVLFQKDYQAREVFAFLRVETIRELEEHAPQAIIEQMTRPLVQTVDRIRKALALNNRCLARDDKFAVEFLNRLTTG